MNSDRIMSTLLPTQHKPSTDPKSQVDLERTMEPTLTRVDFIHDMDPEKLAPAATDDVSKPPTYDPPRTSHQVTLIACGFFQNFILSGLNNAWPVLMLYHLNHAGDSGLSILPKEVASNRSRLAWIGSTGGSATSYFLTLAIVMALCRSAVTTFHRSWPCFSSVSYMTGTGSILMFTGHLLASFSTQYWQLLLTQGIFAGIGGAILYNPVTTIASEYFSENSVGVCLGIMAAGAGVGGVTFPPLAAALLEKYGMRVTLRLLGLIVGIIGLIGAVIVPPPRPMPNRRLVPRKACKSLMFWSVIVAEIAANLTAFIPNTYGPEFSKSVLGFSVKKAATLSLFILNGVGIFGRIGLGFVRDRFGSQNTLILSSAILAISTSLWYSSSKTADEGTWYAFLVIWGMFLSGFGTIVNAYVADVFGGEEMFAILACVNIARGIGSVAGPPLAGYMIGESVNYEQTIGYLGAMLMVTVIILGFARGWIARRVGWIWIA